MRTLRLSAVLLAACGAAQAGVLYQNWTMPLLNAYVDSVTESGGSAQDLPTENFIVVSLSTMDYRVSGFVLNLGVLMDDGTLLTVYRSNLPVPAEVGKPIVVKVSTGSHVPVKTVSLVVTRLISDSATTLVTQPLR